MKLTRSQLNRMATEHMERRWLYLYTTLQTGKITKRQYMTANRRAVLSNIRMGLVPQKDGAITGVWYRWADGVGAV